MENCLKDQGLSNASCFRVSGGSFCSSTLKPHCTVYIKGVSTPLVRISTLIPYILIRRLTVSILQVLKTKCSAVRQLKSLIFTRRLFVLNQPVQNFSCLWIFSYYCCTKVFFYRKVCWIADIQNLLF